MAKSDAETLLADNRKAGHDYHILDTFEAGVMLVGTEVKAIREGRINLRDSYCKFEGDEAFLLNVHIGQYSHGGYASHEPTRKRKLLLNRTEPNNLLGKTTEKGLTIVPLRMYFTKRRIKLALAHAKAKKAQDKGDSIRPPAPDRK